MFGNITIKNRPLRLAFFISPDKIALRKAMQINCTLWGGTYNPIIPLYAHAPKNWKLYPGQKIAMSDRIAGYVRAFDPDILVNRTGASLHPRFGELRRLTISADEILVQFFIRSR
jgi:hypothetical protein